MERLLEGSQWIEGRSSAEGGSLFTAYNPTTGAGLAPEFREASAAEVDRAASAAAAAFDEYRAATPDRIAAFLEAIAEQILALGDSLLERCQAETALPLPRLIGERSRTINQALLFAQVVREGSWVDARIDCADPGRQPPPKPDVRRMLVPIGPVAVFGASNFPLAISVAGNDSISALAAGCPVVVKAHPAHPGTCELVGGAVVEAAERTGMPPGVFSMLHGARHEVGLQLVRHRLIKAVAFTGSLSGGRALFDAASARPEPIPVFAEMGSLNPVFLLPGALTQRAEGIAQGFVASMTLGVGQFCTRPGLVIGRAGAPLSQFRARVGELVRATAPATMLHAGIHRAFVAAIERLSDVDGVSLIARSESTPGVTQAPATVFATAASALQDQSVLREEVFGPCSILVECGSARELEKVAEQMDGSLSAALQGTEEDLRENRRLVEILERKVGRIVFNSFPTGIEVCAAMNHGGPYPATVYGQSTSMGPAAILRFGRPVCYQGFPDPALPAPLQNANPRGIWRLVDGEMSREPIQSA